MARAAHLAAALSTALLAPAFLAPAFADSVAEFYKDKTITMLVGFPPGGLNDISARLVARHIVKHLPGNPRQVVQNMPGAGGLTATNYLYNVAPKDGTHLAGILRSIPQSTILDRANARFDPAKFVWLGSTSSFANDAYAMTIMADRPIKSWQDIKGTGRKVHLGAVGPDSKTQFAVLSREVLGLDVTITMGYPGAAQLFLAMQHGEIDGQFNSISSTRAGQKALWDARKFHAIVQYGRTTRHPELPDTPTARELITNPDDLPLLALIEAPFYMSLPFAAPPGTPPDRAAALRAAFDKAHKDAEFIAEATKAELDVSPIDGAAVDKLVHDMSLVPEAVLTRYRKIIAADR